MTQWFPAAAIATFVLGAQVTYAQTSPTDVRSTRRAFPAGSIEGRVLDDAQAPISGAMVSVIGRTIAAASTDRDGRYTLRELPFGPYILSVHSRGYFTSRGRTLQLTTTRVFGSRDTAGASRSAEDPGCNARGPWSPPRSSPASAPTRRSPLRRPPSPLQDGADKSEAGNRLAASSSSAQHPEGRFYRRRLGGHWRG